MEIITSSMKCICYPPILFFLYKLLFFVPLLQCSATDCLEEGFTITTNDTKTNLVSPGGVFEFGFFTPDEKTENSRYLGIWYHNQSYPKVIVWVANRDKPLLDSYGYLQLSRGQANLLDKNGDAYWSTGGPANRSNLTSNELFHLQLIGKSASNHSRRCRPEDNCTHGVFNFSRLCLVDDGNLILTDRSVQRQPTLWQSFNNPTDTFLPGMVANESIDLLPLSLNLISWQNDNNPAHGNFTFPLQLSPANNLYILEKGVSNYWQSGTTPFDKIPSALFGLWSNNSNPSLQKNTRLVMNFTGQIQLWSWTSERGWSLNWSEPKDGCSLNDKCGHFGSCNGNNGLLCKCLPGFKPTAKWKSGDFSGGCSQKSGPVSERNDYSNDIFLTLPMMKLANRTCSVATSSEDSCKVQCLNNIYCVAYFEGPANCSGAGALTEKKCLTWTELSDLQEESPDGITILVRTTQDDIDPTSRGCSPCGTYIIPYPLSTGGNCGDPSYSHFHCNKQTGQVHFLTSSGNFRVNSIDPDKKLFSIQVMHNICDDKYIHLSVLSLNNSLPFTFRNCNVVENQPLIQVAQPFIEVEIGWNPPPEFSCRAPLNCSQWPHTTCKAKGGDMRCICGSKFRWNGLELECTRVPFPMKVVVPCVAGALAIILVCSILSIYHIRKRRMVKGRDLSEFKGDDTEGIDVPFFNWESILAATNNFADANKLGTGGFGSVYRGELPDGQIIAVKRLSSVSVEGIAEFKTEVMLIAKLQHRNLVRLIGYCTKADEKILVYEYMPNGSLDSCLFDERHSVYLDWKKRFEIILGIARGLLYLHQDSRLRIIHRDLKPSNILLDEELNPKISDFGIARIVGGKETEASTGKVVGTYGYMSPEYAYEGIFSLKSDVFSFGVVILETIRGKRNSRIFIFEHGVNLLGHAWKMWNEDQGLELMDPKLNESCIYSEVLRCIHIGLLCVQEDPSDRPSMSTVVHMLSAENASLPPAKQPAFMNRRPLSENASTSSAKDSSGHEVMSV